MTRDAGPVPVVGLEVHVQLATATKLFCGDAVRFGAPPNRDVCPVCLGLPGALPVLNGRAVELAARAALALGAAVHPRSAFARKSYGYPDLPKGYQITQHERPLATGGWVDLVGEGIPAPRRVRIRRLHLEEDTGRSLHDRVAGATAIDFGRAGVPLVEIVTEPDLRGPAEARRFLDRLKHLLRYLEVSDCSMEEGSLRVDANVSLPRADGSPGSPTEIKNLNSFAGVERAIRFEAARQERIRERGERVERVTLLWDAALGEARPVRSKEEVHDYRYFPEPDLGPLRLTEAWIEARRLELPELPDARARRLMRSLGIAADAAAVLCASRSRADYFESVVRAGCDPAEAANWVRGDLLAAAAARGVEVDALPVPAERMAELLRMLVSGALTRPAAKAALERMVETGESAASVVEAEGLGAVRDPAALEAWIDAAIRTHPDEVARLRAGEERLLGFLIGRVVRLARGRADPREVAGLLRRRLEG